VLALAESGNVTDAARRAGLARVTVYRYWENDEELAKLFDEALRLGQHGLEDEARRRAYTWVLDPVVYQGKIQEQEVYDQATGEITKIPVAVRRYSDVLLMFLLKAAFPEKYKERQAVEHQGAVPTAPAVDLKKLSDDELVQFHALLKKARPD